MKEAAMFITNKFNSSPEKMGESDRARPRARSFAPAKKEKLESR